MRRQAGAPRVDRVEMLQTFEQAAAVALVELANELKIVVAPEPPGECLRDIFDLWAY